MGFPILERCHLYIESAPWLLMCLHVPIMSIIIVIKPSHSDSLTTFQNHFSVNHNLCIPPKVLIPSLQLLLLPVYACGNAKLVIKYALIILAICCKRFMWFIDPNFQGYWYYFTWIKMETAAMHQSINCWVIHFDELLSQIGICHTQTGHLMTMIRLKPLRSTFCKYDIIWLYWSLSWCKLQKLQFSVDMIIITIAPKITYFATRDWFVLQSTQTRNMHTI